MPLAPAPSIKTTTVGMGEMSLASGEECLKSILGSCIGLVLYHPRLKVGALAHIVLPKAEGRPGGAGKFADLAIPEMLNQLSQAGVQKAGLVAKIFGGASMFGGNGPMQIGISNLEAVKAELAKVQIPIRATDVGGNKGRMITFFCDSGLVRVDISGKTVHQL